MVLDPDSRDKTSLYYPGQSKYAFLIAFRRDLSVSPIHFQKMYAKDFFRFGAYSCPRLIRMTPFYRQENWQDMRIKLSEVFSRLKGLVLESTLGNAHGRLIELNFWGIYGLRTGLSVDESK